MTSEAVVAAGVRKPRFRWKRVVVGAAVVVVIGAAANLLGWNIRGWFHDLWDTITEISAAHLVGAVALTTIQTTATAFGWYSILRFAYPGKVRWLDILAAYAASSSSTRIRGRPRSCSSAAAI
jgi:uncharacterized membrane protein YbhN (UPF0104 family)